MMPLWTTAGWPLARVVKWALAVVGPPWVAQQVCRCRGGEPGGVASGMARSGNFARFAMISSRRGPPARRPRSHVPSTQTARGHP